MVIDKQRYPVLESLEACPRMGFLSSFEPLENESQEVMNRIYSYYSGELRNEIGNNVKLITDTFSTAMEESMSSFARIDYREFANSNIQGQGCLVFGKTNPNIVFYFRRDNILELHHFTGQTGSAIASMIAVDLSPCVDDSQPLDFIPESSDGSTMGRVKIETIYLARNWMNQYGIPIYEYMYSLVTKTILFFIFEKYAKVHVETETAFARRKSRSKIYNEKVSNAFHFDIQLRDCTWFTTICRNEDFKVSGHLRLQPCGKNLQDRRLIYISEYVKHGYSRKAALEKTTN